MRNWIAKLQANPWLVKRLVVLALLVAVGAGGFWWGRKQTAGGSATKDGPNDDPRSNNGRVVAYIYGDQPVPREELAEYLIARFGQERLAPMVMRKIVDIECKKHDIYVTEGEINQRLDMELRAIGGATKMPLEQFEKTVLRQWGQTLYEHREDVLRPKIMIEKLVRQTLKVTEEDVKKGFEAKYGPKVECRMIVLDGKTMSINQKVWEYAKKGRAEYLDQASKQPIKQLADAAGKVPPFHKHLGEPTLEETAFRMKEGDISALLPMNDGTCVILLCEKHLPADFLAKYQDVRAQLSRELLEMRVQQKVPEVFAKMREAARPELFPLSPLSSNIQTTSFTRESVSKVEVPPAPVQGEVKVGPGIEKGQAPPDMPPVVKGLPKPPEVKDPPKTPEKK
ncbi:MAG: hypothetical protein EXR98_16365 [Gemmataceae bacterium]|nr:hypothetical protein [Gemmataceae bacterium]